MDIRGIKVKKAQSLRKLADELENLQPIDTKTFSHEGAIIVDAENSIDSIIPEISDFCDRDHFYVYFFEIDDQDIDKVFNAFGKARKSIDWALPRVNSPSSTLYVGSSRTNLVSRIKQHMGITGAKGTYAMHLIHVIPKLNFRMTVLKFSKIRPSLLQIFEDSLHEALRPMFGRKGAK